jgi:hypothetical protein
VVRHCDAYVAAVRPGFERGCLERAITHSRCAKGRLLHYYPQSSCDAAGTTSCSSEASSASSSNNNAVKDDAFSNWCGWHLDHGSLTGIRILQLSLLLTRLKH